MFSIEDIEGACGELKASSAAGADGVPACLLKSCKKELSKPLHILWRPSLDKGLIPADLLLVLISSAEVYPKTTGQWHLQAIL